MNTTARLYIKQNICATCLSQNRKMFRFCDLKMQMKYPTPTDLALCASDDMVCWECKAHLLKMSSFRARAATAQAVLRTLVRGKDIHLLNSLSDMTISSLPPLVIKLQDINKTETSQNTTLNHNQTVLFVNETPLKDESEIKVEIENQDDTSMDQNIFASELDILEDFNLKTGLDVKEKTFGADEISDQVKKIKRESKRARLDREEINKQCSSRQTRCRKIVSQEKGGQKTHSQQTLGQKTGGQQVLSQQKGGQEILGQQKGGQETEGQQISQKVEKVLSDRRVSDRGEKRNIDGDSSNTESDYEFAKPVEVIPASRLSVGDTYQLKFGAAVKDIFSVNKINHEELTELRAKRAKHRKFANCNWKCDGCLINLVYKHAFEEHMLMHKGKEPYVCDICTVRFRSESTLKQHRAHHYRLYKCVSCKFSSLSMEFAMRHFSRYHEANTMTCRQCDLQFVTFNDYKLHRRSVHGSRPKCDMCGRHFFTKQTLERHIINSHGQQDKVECPICHRKYRGEWAVEAHINRIHKRDTSKKDEAAYCAECDKHFSSTISYKAHIKTALAHNNSGKDFKYQCELCKKKFFSPFYLKQHTAAVHLDDLNYPCEICEEKFKTQKQRRLHVRRKHEGFVLPKNKVCEICSKAFSSLAILRDHLNMHKGERPYVCNICGDSFGFKSALFTHRRLKHKIPRLKDLQKEKKKKPENFYAIDQNESPTISENSNLNSNKE